MKIFRILAFLSLLPILSCAKKDASSGTTEPESAGKPPEKPASFQALGRDNLPVGWIDAPYARHSLYFVQDKPAPCPPCPPDAECAKCPTPFYLFSTKAASDPTEKLVLVEFTKPARGLKIGGFYHLSGRTVNWAPYGEVLVSMENEPKEWFPPEKCQKLVTEYLAVRDASPGTCAKDDECTILPGGVDDCGRAIDKKTAATLEETYKMYRDMCGLKLRCGPRVAFPRCKDGRCIETQEK